ncbi:MAG: Hsp33 family molecular chaperone HslO [Azospirillaceae bacterium]|nr:Hsp33 family molecular chaperone HslO [Azospirillaceae bacterium]
MTSAPQRPFDQDVIQPFQIDATALRGRLVRLGPALDEILGRHDYPLSVAHLLGETLTLAVALAAALKYEGIFTLQIKGDGPVSLIVADVTSAGDLRAYGQFDTARVAKQTAAGWTGVALLGKGHLAFTVDQGEHSERYQGIVALLGRSLVECVQHYFRQSEQLQTTLRLAVDRSDSGWHSGAIMLQRMPGPVVGAGDITDEAQDADGWTRAKALLQSCSDAELRDSALPARDLLFRLFHEDGVRVFGPQPVRFGCRCSRERVVTVLQSLPADDIDHMRVDGVISATCEFCNATYTFDEDQIATLRAR